MTETVSHRKRYLQEQVGPLGRGELVLYDRRDPDSAYYAKITCLTCWERSIGSWRRTRFEFHRLRAALDAWQEHLRSSNKVHHPTPSAGPKGTPWVGTPSRKMGEHATQPGSNR
jgi:hypothetical protein